MKVLVVGNGGREHALAWKLLQSQQVEQAICVPGNGGTALMENCCNLPLPTDDFEGMIKLVCVHEVSLVVVGPELPLAQGITDRLQQGGIAVFGPTQAGAQIESSKSWAKALMKAAGIPTARAEVFCDPEAAKAYVQDQGAPIVVKADGLAAGKGVTVAQTEAEAHQAIEALFKNHAHPVVIEECLRGQEVSVLALSDGSTVRTLLPAQDHKRIGEGDTGANTGGMGAYAPAPILTPQLQQRVEQEILTPTLAALQERGIDYRGVLYAGLMITPQGDLKVLEFNCRFGDPEIQAILPLLATPLEKLLLACVEGRLADLPPIQWHPGSAICVVAASGGYPGAYQTGYAIAGLEAASATGATVFHAGTKLTPRGQLVTDGGRVLNVTATGATFSQAAEKAYRALDCIQFARMYYRRDIGHQVRESGSGSALS